MWVKAFNNYSPVYPTGQGFGGLQYAGNTASVFTSFLFGILPSGLRFCFPSPVPPVIKYSMLYYTAVKTLIMNNVK